MRDVRIQKAMSDMGICSRRQAERFIARGRVKLNGRPVSPGDKMDMSRDVISLDGKTWRPRPGKAHVYYMLNKPRGYITTTGDEKGRKTVMDLVRDIPGRIYPVGRLDRESEGLLLFTDDGELANRLTHPSHAVSKTYRVTVRPAADREQTAALSKGVKLDDGFVTAPAVVRVLAEEENRGVLEITIKEGKNRQIRRMCRAVGLEVARLVRKSLGPLKLGMLRPGAYRPLTDGEIRSLKAVAFGAAKNRTED